MATINTDAEIRAYHRLRAAGMTPAGACGLIGNLEAESDGFYPNRVEYLCLRSLKEKGKAYTDETYTDAIDSGKISCEEFLHPLPGKQYGYGLAQWTSPGRKAGLWNLAKQKGVSIADEDMQMEYLLHELEEKYEGVLKVLKTATSIRTASDKVLLDFESPSGITEATKHGRAARGQRFYDNYVKNGDVEMDKQEIIKNVINDAVQYAVGIANDNYHGYSQAARSLYNTKNPTSFDCSSLMLTAIQYAFEKNGIKPTPKDINAKAKNLDEGLSYTGNMLNLQKLGFEVVATNQTAHGKMQKGDLELSLWHHVAMAIDGDNIVHARSSEGTSDTKDGSGNEIRTQPWYQYSKGWTHRLRFTGKGIDFSKIQVSGVTGGTQENKPGGGKYMFSVGNVKKGSQGNDVKLLQRLLKSNGCKGKDGKPLKLDGDCGDNTVYAIKTYQKKKGIKVDGCAGENTWKSILLR